MFPPLAFRDVFADLHLDTVIFLALMAAGYARTRHALRAGRTAKHLPRATWALAGVAVVLPVLVAEGLTPLRGHGLSGNAWTALLTRLAFFAAGAAIAGLLLRSGLESARFWHHLRVNHHRNRKALAAQAAAEAASRAKSEFLSTMSHEIRTPLNALLAAADAVSRMPMDRLQRTQLTRIVNESTRLGRTLNEILDLRRIEEGHIVLQRIPFAPVETAREVLDLFAARAEEKRLELKLQADAPAGLMISGDPRRFRQVLANLLDNGIKFTTRGAVTVTVGYTAPTTPDAVALMTVRVQDTGVGITTEQRTCLHGGTTSRPAGGISTTGFGLVIGQRLVRLMGGEITVRSASGEGSEFAFTLPVIVLDPPAPPASAARKLDGRRRVLIVDDVAANRLMLQMFLEQQGFSADYASGGEDAVQLAARNRYDAILMDLQMPEVDGYTATRRIRAAESETNRSVIVAVTACVDAPTREKCLAAGMNAHFSKPLDLRKFCGALTDLIAARQGNNADEPGSASPLSGLAAPLPQTGR